MRRLATPNRISRAEEGAADWFRDWTGGRQSIGWLPFSGSMLSPQAFPRSYRIRKVLTSGVFVRMLDVGFEFGQLSFEPPPPLYAGDDGLVVGFLDIDAFDLTVFVTPLAVVARLSFDGLTGDVPAGEGRYLFVKFVNAIEHYA